jgi:hypothetical protein
MHRRLISLLMIFAIILLISSPALAQSYYFQVPKETIDAYWNSDGTLALVYVFDFVNSSSGHVIDYVDLGLPNSNYSDNNITASVNGNPIHDISSSGYEGQGPSGVAIGLGQYTIQPGASGTVQAQVNNIRGVLFPDSQDSNLASAVLGTSYFSSSFVSGKTDLTVTFHLPPGVKSSEPKYHAAPSGFPSQPTAAIDSDGRIIYTWENPNANAYTQYTFGASFPKSYVPSGAVLVATPTPIPVNVSPSGGIIGFISGAVPFLICIIGFVVIVGAGLSSSSRRKQQYLPPKISIEGHGIKRGLTSVEAAILLEQPLDKIMTMILFSVIKKNSAEVVTRDPLEIKVNQPIQEDLQPYEKDFLAAFQKTGPDRQKGLRDMVVNLVNSISAKMKGFSRQETIAYYKDITKRAWEQVEAANTPEVKSQKYEEVMEWTMLDKDYEGRTQDVFRNMPVFIPIWWGHYDPTFGRAAAAPAATPASMGAGSVRVPGADFTKSITSGVQTFSSKVVGNINDFTSRITSITNPAPKVQTSSSKGGFKGGGGGCVCACACACAGCACACAGGGR